MTKSSADPIVTMVANMMLKALRARYGRDVPTAVVCRSKLEAKVSVVDVVFSPDEVSTVYGVRYTGKTKAHRRAWDAARRTWSESSHAYVEERVGDDKSLVHVLDPWKTARRKVADHLDAATERLLPLTIARPVEPEVELTLDALRMMAGKIGLRVGGMAPLSALRDVVAAAPGWSWSSETVPQDVGYVDFGRNPALVALVESVRSTDPKDGRAGWHVSDSGGMVALWRYDRDMTRADLDAAVVGLHRRDRSLSTDLPAGSVLYESAELVFDVQPDGKGHPVVSGSGRRVVVLNTVRIATPANVATSPDGRQHTVVRWWELYPQKAAARSAYRAQSGKAEDLVDASDFLHTAYRSGLGDVCDGMLASFPPDELRRLMYRMAVADLRGTAECQLCGNVQKLRHAYDHRTATVGVMVDHGYHYPLAQGWKGGDLGHRADPCEAVSEAPYERSCEFLRTVAMPRCERSVDSAKRVVDVAKQDLAERRSVSVPTRWVNHVEDAPKGVRVVTLHAGDPQWRHYAEILVLVAERDLRDATFRLEWVRRRVDQWKAEPLYDERVAAERKAR